MNELETRLRHALRNPNRDQEAPTTDEVMRGVHARLNAPAPSVRGRRFGSQLLPMLAVATAVVAVIAGAAALAERDDNQAAHNEVPAVGSSQREVTVYLLSVTRTDDGEFSYHLAPETMTTEDTGDVGVDAVRALLTTRSADPDHVNGFNPLTIEPVPITGVNAVTERGGVITVDLTEDVWDPYPAVECMCPGEIITQQLVWTVQTALRSNRPITVTINGEPARGIWLEPLEVPVPADPAALEPVKAAPGAAPPRVH
jgi:hypothetical protein